MSQLTWNDSGAKLFEVGVDRGVVYVNNGNGIAWNGLIGIDEGSSGGELREFFIDGIKYLHFITTEEYTAKIEAFMYPDEFAVCDGTSKILNGLSVTQQRRVPFHLAYRTKLGNDLEGNNYAYKLHIVYNAYALPTDRSYQTIGANTNPMTFNWDVSTKGSILSGYKNSAHFVIDSRKTPPELLSRLETLIYGSADADAQLPSAKELSNMFVYYLPSAFYDAGGVIAVTTNFIDGGPANTAIDYILDGGKP